MENKKMYYVEVCICEDYVYQTIWFKEKEKEKFLEKLKEKLNKNNTKKLTAFLEKNCDFIERGLSVKDIVEADKVQYDLMYSNGEDIFKEKTIYIK